MRKTKRSLAASLLGRIKSKEKAEAARKNGLLGGWHKNFKKKK